MIAIVIIALKIQRQSRKQRRVLFCLNQEEDVTTDGRPNAVTAMDKDK